MDHLDKSLVDSLDPKEKYRRDKLLFEWCCGNHFNTWPIYRTIFDKIIQNEYKLNDETISLILTTEYDAEYVNVEWSVMCWLNDIRDDIIQYEKWKLLQKWVEYEHNEDIDQIATKNAINNAKNRLFGEIFLTERSIATLKFLEQRQNMGFSFNSGIEQRLKQKNILVDSNSTGSFYTDKDPYPDKIDNVKDRIWFDGKEYHLTDSDKKIYLDFMNNINKVTPGCDLIYTVSDDDNDSNDDDSNGGSGSDESDNEGIRFQLVNVPSARKIGLEIVDSEYNNLYVHKLVTESDTNNIDSFQTKFTDTFMTKSARFHLYFYGKAINMNENIIKNYNNNLFLGQSGDVGQINYLDVMMDKNKSVDLYLIEIFFIFKNKFYTNFTNNPLELFDDKYLVVLNDGTVGRGATFYPFDVVLDPHPNLIINRDIIIKSPINIACRTNFSCCYVE